MGNDGGSIPRRIELVKEKQKQVKQNPNLQREAAWFHCALSKRRLEQPIVADRMGKLYNQEVVIEYILDPTTYGDADKICPYVTSTKDVKKLNLTVSPQRTQNTTSSVMGSLENELKSKFICPVSMKEMNGKHRFVYLAQCGCVFAEQTLKEVSQHECLTCGKPFDPSDIITINPTDKDEIEQMRIAMEERKKHKKKKNKRPANGDTNGTAVKKTKVAAAAHGPASQSMASAVLDKVNKELAERHQKNAVSSNIQSLYSNKEKDKQKQNGNYLTMGTFNRYN
ncbi:Rtf2 RING-finger-domain-containing protein [Gongronella butleri]|nr:Rtf2 RING-finger-domain-containing protein [Gongronella butleri]